MTGGAFALSLSLSVDGFEVTKGEPVLGGMQAEPKHYHCPALQELDVHQADVDARGW